MFVAFTKKCVVAESEDTDFGKDVFRVREEREEPEFSLY